MAELKLKVDTKIGKNFEGELHFEQDTQKKTIKYWFDDNKPSGSLKDGDELNITFKVDDVEFPIKGTYPGILKSLPEKALYIYALSYETICDNVFHILASINGEETDIKSISEEMSGEVGEDAIYAIFEK